MPPVTSFQDTQPISVDSFNQPNPDDAVYLNRALHRQVTAFKRQRRAAEAQRIVIRHRPSGVM